MVDHQSGEKAIDPIPYADFITSPHFLDRLSGAVEGVQAYLPQPVPIHTSKHAFIALGGTDSEWQPHVPVQLQRRRQVDLGSDASFECYLTNTAFFEFDLPEIDDDGHFKFEQIELVSKPSDYNTLVRLHLLWTIFLKEFQLFKKELHEDKNLQEWTHLLDCDVD